MILMRVIPIHGSLVNQDKFNTFLISFPSEIPTNITKKRTEEMAAKNIGSFNADRQVAT